MAGVKTNVSSEDFCFVQTAAVTLAGNNPVWSDFVGVGKIIVPDNELIPDAVPDIDATGTEITKEVYSRTTQLKKAGPAEDSQMDFSFVYSAAADSDQGISAEMATLMRTVEGLTVGNSVSIAILSTNDTWARDTDGALNATLPTWANATVDFVRGEVLGYTKTKPLGNFGSYTLKVTPQTIYRGVHQS